MQNRFGMLSILIASVLIFAGCVSHPQAVKIEANTVSSQKAPTGPEQKSFDMLQARAAMDAAKFDNPARITPVWSATGDTFAYTYNGGVRVRDAVTGALIFELDAEILAAELSVSPDDLSVEIDENEGSLTLSAGEHGWSRPLEQAATPQKNDPRTEPRLVREMFPMNGYDRREVLSPDGTMFASLDGNELAIRRAGEDTVLPLTSEQDAHIRWFHGNDIWEASGDIWNAEGTHFIARKHDARLTPGLLSLNYMESSETLTDFRYWARAGDPLPVTTLFSVSAADGTLTQLGEPSGTQAHLFFVEWSPSGDAILAIRYERDLSRQTILSIDIATGLARTLLVQAAETGWVKWPSGPQTIRHLSDDKYLFRTDASGYFNYVVLGADGTELHALTNMNADVGDVIAVDETNGWLYFLAPSSTDRPYDQIPHRVRLAGGEAEALTDRTGVFSAWLSPDKQHLIWTHADIQRATQAELASTDGEVIATIESVDTPTSILGAPLPEEAVFTSFDGSQVHAMILKPAGFDPEQRYPVIHRVYGAMQSKVRRNGFWPEGLNWPGSEYYTVLNYLAQQGFVIVLMDPPGTPGRGRDYNLEPWGTWPGDTARHYVAGLNALGQDRPWMDLNRVGVDGNSWGGYISLHTALEHPDLYRASAISVPEIDLLDHVHWIEWQLGTPQANKEAYESGALQNRIDELASDLLVIAGTSDANVSISNTMKLLDALAEAGKPYELVLFPGTNHPHNGRGDRYAYAAERIRSFFDEALKPLEAME